MQQYLYNEVDEIIESLYYKIAESEFGGQLNVLFLQYGKGTRVKIGSSVVDSINNFAKSTK